MTDYIPECIMEKINEDKKVQKINRYMNTHGYCEQKQTHLEMIEDQYVHEYYDTMNGISKKEQRNKRNTQNQCNKFVSDFVGITEQPKPPSI